ncbi:MAG: tetratricopeptide repeat protein [Paracoccaceae bacterium]
MNVPMCQGAEAIERDIELIATHLRLGNLMRAPGPEQDLSAAIKNYSHAIDIDNSTILQYQQDHGLKYLGLEALLQRARTYGAMHELDRAAADIDLLLNIWPQHSLPWFEKARIEIARGGFSEAVRLLDKAIERQPDFAQAYYHRAYAHQKLGDNAQAARDCRTAQTFDPSIKCN